MRIYEERFVKSIDQSGKCVHNGRTPIPFEFERNGHHRHYAYPELSGTSGNHVDGSTPERAPEGYEKNHLGCSAHVQEDLVAMRYELLVHEIILGPDFAFQDARRQNRQICLGPIDGERCIALSGQARCNIASVPSAPDYNRAGQPNHR